MYQLSAEQADMVQRLVDRQDIHFRHLAIDLVDHLCCQLEERLEQGRPFQEAFSEILDIAGTDALQEIQKDTLYLTDKKYRRMKNSMKIAGVAGMALMSFGAVFKIQHWPGAAVLIVLGFILLGGIFFPVSMMVMRKESRNLDRPAIYLTAFIGSLAVMLAILLKVMHWPGANPMFLAGYGLLGLVFLPLLLVKMLQNTSDKGSRRIYITGAVSLFLCMAGVCMKFNHFPGARTTLFLGTLMMTAIFIPLYVFKEFKGFQKVEPLYIFLCIGMVYFNLFNLLLSYK